MSTNLLYYCATHYRFNFGGYSHPLYIYIYINIFSQCFTIGSSRFQSVDTQQFLSDFTHSLSNIINGRVALSNAAKKSIEPPNEK